MATPKANKIYLRLKTANAAHIFMYIFHYQFQIYLENTFQIPPESYSLESAIDGNVITITLESKEIPINKIVEECKAFPKKLKITKSAINGAISLITIKTGLRGKIKNYNNLIQELSAPNLLDKKPAPTDDALESDSIIFYPQDNI
ncbi:hypothetical protein IJ096_03140 [Candidatus Saccharibacteria bacterium]|nr:hypothetical protein [Candidatus Saccharibacteria bacterium]